MGEKKNPRSMKRHNKLQEKHKTDRKTNREDNSIVALHEERHTTCTQIYWIHWIRRISVFCLANFGRIKIFWKYIWLVDLNRRTTLKVAKTNMWCMLCKNMKIWFVWIQFNIRYYEKYFNVSQLKPWNICQIKGKWGNEVNTKYSLKKQKAVKNSTERHFFYDSNW